MRHPTKPKNASADGLLFDQLPTVKKNKDFLQKGSCSSPFPTETVVDSACCVYVLEESATKKMNTRDSRGRMHHDLVRCLEYAVRYESVHFIKEVQYTCTVRVFLPANVSRCGQFSFEIAVRGAINQKAKPPSHGTVLPEHTTSYRGAEWTLRYLE